MDDELFKLCSEVYKRTGWKETDFAFCEHELDGNIILPYYRETENYQNWFEAPLYTSDYLLEKLPPVIFTRTSDGSNLTAILTLWVNGDKTVHTAYMIPFDEQNRGDYAKTADTPLKALLRLTLALKDAGEL